MMKTVLSKHNLTQSLTTVTGVLASTVASSHAIVTLNQITLTGNKLTMNSNTLNADVTGDGIDDIAITDPMTVRTSTIGLRFKINGNRVAASFSSSSSFVVDAAFGSGGVGIPARFNTALTNIKYLNPISFTDARINGGALTQGYLEVNAFNTSSTQHTVELTRLVFNPNSTTMGTSGLSTSATYTEWSAVPEPSSFGLLALGVGGLLARRRRQAA